MCAVAAVHGRCGRWVAYVLVADATAEVGLELELELERVVHACGWGARCLIEGSIGNCEKEIYALVSVSSEYGVVRQKTQRRLICLGVRFSWRLARTLTGRERMVKLPSSMARIAQVPPWARMCLTACSRVRCREKGWEQESIDTTTDAHRR